MEIDKSVRHIEAACGVACIYPADYEEYDVMSIIVHKVRDEYGTYENAIVHHPVQPINSDDQGLYLGEKRGDFPADQIWNNLYAYAYWKNPRQKNEVKAIVDEWCTIHPSSKEKISLVYDYARAIVLNARFQKLGMNYECPVTEPWYDKLHDIVGGIENFGDFVGQRMMSVVECMIKNGAPDSIIEQTVDGLCERINNNISETLTQIEEFAKSIQQNHQPQMTQQEMMRNQIMAQQQMAAYNDLSQQQVTPNPMAAGYQAMGNGFPQGVNPMLFMHPVYDPEKDSDMMMGAPQMVNDEPTQKSTSVKFDPYDISDAIQTEEDNAKMFEDIGPITFSVPEPDPTEFVHPNDPRFRESYGFNPMMGAYGNAQMPMGGMYYGNGGMNGNF